MPASARSGNDSASSLIRGRQPERPGDQIATLAKDALSMIAKLNKDLASLHDSLSRPNGQAQMTVVLSASNCPGGSVCEETCRHLLNSSISAGSIW